MNTKSTLKQYVESMPRGGAASFAKRIGVSRVYLYQLMARQAGREPGSALSVVIERESSYVVTRRELRPDDWHHIWPELQHSGRGRAECAA